MQRTFHLMCNTPGAVLFRFSIQAANALKNQTKNQKKKNHVWRENVASYQNKQKESRQILPKSRSLAQPTNGSRSLRFYVCRSHFRFSIKSLHFFVSVSDFKMPVSASRRVTDSPFTTPNRRRTEILTAHYRFVIR